MKRNLLVPTLALLLTGCLVENRSSIEILDRAAPTSTTTCEFGSGGKTQLNSGVLDVAYPNLTYGLVLYVNNNLADPQATTPETLRSSKDWTAVAARVRVNPSELADQFAASPPLLSVATENTTLIPGKTVPVGGSGVVTVDAVSNALGAKLAAALNGGAARTVMLGITLQGLTKDGARLDSGEWPFSLTVCAGCLAPPACVAPQQLVSSTCFDQGQDAPSVCK